MKNKNSATKSQIYFWNLAGSVFNALSSIILLMIVTRTADNYYADMFSFSFALSQLLATIGLFQVRNYQSTDVCEKYNFDDYFSFRIITCFFMLVVTILYIQVKGYSFEKKIVIFLLISFRCVEAISDVFQGLFQQKERLDLSGKSLSLKAIVSSVAFAVCMIITKNLVYSCACLFLSSLLCFLVFDLKKYKNFTLLEHTLHHIHNNYHKLYNILWQCLPLFINGFLIMAIYNAPKNAIDLCTERGFVQAGIQTDYNIIFMPASVINLFLIFLRPFMTQMAYARTQKNDRNFYKMLRKIIGGLLVFSLISIIGAYLLGIPVLELIYSRDLVSYRTELIIIMVAGGMNSLATALDNIVTVIRAQHILVFSYLFAWIVVKIISYNIVKEYSLHGAVIVFLIAMLILLITNLFILIVGLKKKKTA